MLCLSALVVTAALGMWQVSRGHQKQAAQAVADAAMQSPPTVLDGSAMPSGPDAWPARVLLTGRFDAEHTVFLDNRTRQGVPGFHVVTPLCLDRSGNAAGAVCVAVLRGWIALNAAQRDVPPVVTTPQGSVTVQGRSLQGLDQPMLLGRDVEPGPHDRIWQRFDIQRLGRWAGLAMAPVIVRQQDQADVNDNLHRDWNEPGTGAERHFAYAFQWFAMSLLLLIGMVAMAWRQFRGRTVCRRPAAGNTPLD